MSLEEIGEIAVEFVQAYQDYIEIVKARSKTTLTRKTAKMEIEPAWARVVAARKSLGDAVDKLKRNGET